MSEEIDTANKFMVGATSGDRIAIIKIGLNLSRADALNLAAWLVTLADHEDRFPALLETIQR